jgi:hypothetical protein
MQNCPYLCIDYKFKDVFNINIFEKKFKVLGNGPKTFCRVRAKLITRSFYMKAI